MSETGVAAVAIDHLSARYGPLVAVDDVSLTIEQGECFGLLGPNGAGKTTLLSCIEGIKRIDGGRILIREIDVSRNPTASKQLLGVQLQVSSLFNELTAVELVQFYSALYDVYPTKQDALRILERFGLADKAHMPSEQLSGGQQHRLTLALATAHAPAILLLDEPTTGLDPHARRQVWEMVRQLSNEGKTVILTTHYIEEAELLCKRVGIVDHGKLLKVGTPRELVEAMGDQTTVTAMITLPESALDELRADERVESLAYEGLQLAITTHEPQSVVTLIESIGKRYGLSSAQIAVRRPTLEDVFLSLTGRGLEGDAGEAIVAPRSRSAV